ncbi:hypothetical protein NPIL_29211 [Nephila pilipes]|uniref:Uncharacterized protein n=1 Tax=Nephila pilipes TaxID=299642 RepID=A0A8X6R2G7_NEPPI|nr:hypothetical protein NPIL_29211 [Nephila pilipes]
MPQRMPLFPPPPFLLLFQHPSQAIRLSRQSRTVSNIPPHASHCRDAENALLAGLQTMLFQSMSLIKVINDYPLVANCTLNRNVCGGFQMVVQCPGRHLDGEIIFVQVVAR